MEPLHLSLGRELAGVLTAVLAFAAVLYAPGYLYGAATGMCGFRSRSLAGRSLWAVPLSLALSPVGADLLGRVLGLQVLTWIFAGLGGMVLLLLLAEGLHTPRRSRRRLRPGDRAWWTGAAACWTLLTLVLLVDFERGHRLWFSVVMADQSYRIAFTEAVARSGIPPVNPLYFPHGFAPMHYFYFWYVLCAVVMRLGHLSAQAAFTASSVWAGFGLMAVVALYGREFFHWPAKGQRLAVLLLLVSGADLLPALGQALLQPRLNGDTEWWSVDPIAGWPDSLLWVPHHVASALCCLLAFLLLWRSRSLHAPGRDRAASLGLAACALASAVGLSVYVALGFALMMLAWLGTLGWRRRRGWPEPASAPAALLRRSLLVSLLAAALLSPFARELLRSGQAASASPGGAGPSFGPSVRRLIDSGLLLDLPVFAQGKTKHPVLLDQALRLLLLAPGLAMELGLYGLVLWLFLRHRPVARLHEGTGSEARRAATFLATVGLVLTMFLSSSVISNNDFGYRAVLLPQFFLLLLAAELLVSWQPGHPHPVVTPTARRRRAVWALLWVGAAGTLWWAILLRAWLPWEVAHPTHGFQTLPDDAWQIRQAFTTLDSVAPRNAVVAFRPIDSTPDRQGEVMAPNEYYQRMLVMDAGRQMLNAEGKCAVHFGGSRLPCAAIQAEVRRLYAAPLPSAAEAEAACRRLGVSYLVLTPWDPVWRSAEGWAGELPRIAAQPRIRIFQCANGFHR